MIHNANKKSGAGDSSVPLFYLVQISFAGIGIAVFFSRITVNMMIPKYTISMTPCKTTELKYFM